MVTALLERLIHAGKARFETFQAGLANFTYLPVTTNEYIVITGFTFQPPFIANYEAPAGTFTSRANLCKLEFFDGQRYNHFIFKNDGQSTGTATPASAAKRNQFLNVPGLYMVFKNNVGLKVSFPKDEAFAVNSLPFRNNLTPGIDVQIGETPFQTVSNFPANFSNPYNPLGPEYNEFFTPPVLPYSGVDQFNFDSAGNVRGYSQAAGAPDTYNLVSQNDMCLGPILNIQFVRVQQPADQIS